MPNAYDTVRKNKWKVGKARQAANVAGLAPRSIDVHFADLAIHEGSELEKNCKQTAAETAAEWAKVRHDNLGVQVWRVEKFRVVPWPAERYGEFYSGDSYIVCHTYKKRASAPNTSYNLYFWLGKNTSQDEMGTAAYKTVELDEKLRGEAVQHRVVQDYESDEFKALFQDKFIVLEGGVESGFNHVEPEKFQTRLLQCKGSKPVRCRQIDVRRGNLNSGDVFILDTGLKIYQFNGKESRGAERAEAALISRAYDEQRGGKAEVIVWDEGDIADCPRDFLPFWTIIGGEGAIKPGAEGGLDSEMPREGDRAMWRLRLEGGEAQFTKVAEGKAVKRADLQTDDVFIVDTGYQIFVWIGLGAIKEERASALTYADKYCGMANVPSHYPVTKALQGAENEAFEACFTLFA